MIRHMLVLVLCLSALAAAAQPAADAAKPWETWQPPQVVLPQPNAFDTYLKAIDLKLRIDQQQGLGGNPPPPPPDGARDRWGEGPQGVPLPERVALYAEVLTLVRQALRQECRIPLPTAFDEMLPYLADFRGLVRLLAMEAEVKRIEGDYGAAAESALDALRVGQAASTQRILISGLVGIASEAIAFASLDETIPGLSAAECKTVLAQLLEIERTRVPVAEWLTGEEVLTRGYFKQIVIDPKKHEQFLAEAKDLGPEADKVLAELGPKGWEYIGETYEALQQYAALPGAKRPAEPAVPDSTFMKMIVPAMTRVVFKADQSLTAFRLHEAELAVRAYLLETGRLPESLTALVPGYLPAVPADPFGEGPLRAKAATNSLLIYSVGPDGVDDGGKPHKEQFTSRESKGDIVVTVAIPR
ncbi:MAG: hypothetical protein ABFE08_02340 [Armatimonadia bacterium]